MSFEGTLTEVPAPEVFRILGAMGRTGVLHVQRGACRKQIVLDAGRWVFCSSGTMKEVLGQHLVASGVVSEDDLREAVAYQSLHRCRIGEALIALGRVDEATIRSVLAAKIHDSLHDVLTWREGFFKFVETPPLGDRVPFRISAGWEEIVAAGARRAASLEHVHRVLPDLSRRLRVDAARLAERPTQSRVEEAVVQSMLQGDTPADACARLPYADVLVLERMAELVERGVLVADGAAKPPSHAHAQSASAVIEKARRLAATGRSSQALELLAKESHASGPTSVRMHAERRTIEAEIRSRVQSTLGHPERAMLHAVGQRSASGDLTLAESFVVSCVDDGKSVEDVVRGCPFGELEALAAIDGLFRRGALRCALLAEPEAPATDAALAAVGPGTGRPPLPRMPATPARRLPRRQEIDPGPGGR